MTLAQSQRKNLPRFNALETEEHYQQIQKDVRSTSRKNPELDNMVLRIHVAINTKLPDDTSNIDVFEVVDLVGTRRRNVCPFTVTCLTSQCPTSQQEAIANRNQSTYAKKHDALLEHLTCNKHKAKMYCWKPKQPPFNGAICIEIGSRELSEWATAWDNDAATKFAPPEDPLFWKLLENHSVASRRRAALNNGTSESALSSSSSTVINVFYDGKVQRDADSADGLSSHNCRLRPSSLNSPVKGFRPKDYNGVGLHAFLGWCRDYYEDDEYLDVFEALQEHKIGIDLFKRSLRNSRRTEELLRDLKVDCMIKSGMAQRMLHDFEIWYAAVVNNDL